MTTRLAKLSKTLGKNRTLEKDLLAAGYSAKTAHQQLSVTRTKGFKELLDSFLPVTKAFKATNDGFKATKLEGLGNIVPDHNIRLKAAEQTYKLHGVIANDSGSKQDTVTINILNYGTNDRLNILEDKP